MTTTKPNFVDAHYLADLYVCSVDHVRKQARRGDWPGFKIGRREGWRFDLAEIRALVEKRAAPKVTAG